MSNFESIQKTTGLNKLTSNPFALLDFSYLVVDENIHYSSSTGDREVLAVILSGKGNFVVNGEKFLGVGGRANPFSGKPHSVYIPCRAKYSIDGDGGRLEVGLISAPSDLEVPPYIISPDQVTVVLTGSANYSRQLHQILTLSGQPKLPARRLIVGETIVPQGNWSSYPPHRHENDNLPYEAFHEELYFFKLNPMDGFSLFRHYSDDFDCAYTIKDNSIFLGTKGYHTVSCAPGMTTFYIWALAGNQRVQAVVEDPTLDWVGKADPTLIKLGH